jgi:hypothetical protein
LPDFESFLNCLVESRHQGYNIFLKCYNQFFDLSPLPAAMKVAPATSLDKFSESQIISSTGTK